MWDAVVERRQSYIKNEIYYCSATDILRKDIV